jgi:hypothetical protein
MKEVSPLNTIKFIILAVIVLFSFPAPAEIYKYLDDQGNIHYTDDLNQVPLEQRDSIEASLEYDGDLDSDIDRAEAAPDEKENAVLPEDQQEEADSLNLSDDSNAQADLDADRKRLEALKKEIDSEYRYLVEEKARLGKEKESLVNREDILKYNAKVESLNKRAEAYAQKGKKYKEQVDAYNDRVTRQNAEATEKSGAKPKQ